MPNRVQYLAPDIAVHFLKQKLLVEESQVPPALVFIGHPGGEPVQPIVPGKILHLTGWCLTIPLPTRMCHASSVRIFSIRNSLIRVYGGRDYCCSIAAF